MKLLHCLYRYAWGQVAQPQIMSRKVLQDRRDGIFQEIRWTTATTEPPVILSLMGTNSGDHAIGGGQRNQSRQAPMIIKAEHQHRTPTRAIVSKPNAKEIGLLKRSAPRAFRIQRAPAGHIRLIVNPRMSGIPRQQRYLYASV